MKSKDNLIWIDLEMTGLNPDCDVIIEIATIVTDAELNTLAEGPVMAIHQSSDVMAAMLGGSPRPLRGAHTRCRHRRRPAGRGRRRRDPDRCLPLVCLPGGRARHGGRTGKILCVVPGSRS